MAVSQFGDAPKGTLVGLDITYSCIKGSCDYNPYDFVVRAASGEEAATTFEGFSPELHSGNLLAGTKAKGFITYDLAPGAYTVEYRASLFDRQPASWVLNVQ